MGNVETRATGIGNVELISIVNRKTYVIVLEDILYILNTNNSLISLGRLDEKGYRWERYKGILDIKTADGQVIATGKRVNNRLYEMAVETQQAPEEVPHTNATCQDKQHSWEIWHRRYGHVGYHGLERMLREKLVDGFTVDTDSPKPDCSACTAAKLSVTPFAQHPHTCAMRCGQ